jgi:carboxypeptidase Q
MRGGTYRWWVVVTLLSASPAIAATVPDAATIGVSSQRVAVVNEIADLGFNHSEIPETAEYLSDQIGGRMTNSPAMRRAEHWTSERLAAWGLKNVRTEGFDFGRGWWIEAAHIRMVAPRPLELKGIPIAWTPPTAGVLSGSIIVAPMASDKDFADWKGKLSGKIVLASWPAPERDSTEGVFQRLTDVEISRLDKFEQPVLDPEARRKRIERFRYRTQLDEFLAQEGALALVTMSRSDGRLVHGEGYDYRVGHTAKLPAVELAAEDYRRLARLAKLGAVTVEIENRVHFEDADHSAYNVLAEIPGYDPKAGYVMAGAHLDSWVAADGAADNGAGSVMVMEAARILARIGIKPRRTIRFALWAGEEQGLLGSAAYVEKHLALRPPLTDPALKDLPPYFTQDTFPVKTLPEYSELDAYFNIDNGSGKIRGIYTEGNLNVVPIFREWLAPFASMGANAVVAEPTGSTDHMFLARLGLPAFQFIQDPLDYATRVHHTDLDTYDHLRIEDMKQGAVVLASVLAAAAEAAKPLPRKPLPTEPKVTDPFAYPDPSRK